MSTIKNVGELRALIAELPDDMPVIGCDGTPKIKRIVANVEREPFRKEDKPHVDTLIISTDK